MQAGAWDTFPIYFCEKSVEIQNRFVTNGNTNICDGGINEMLSHVHLHYFLDYPRYFKQLCCEREHRKGFHYTMACLSFLF